MKISQEKLIEVKKRLINNNLNRKDYKENKDNKEWVYKKKKKRI
jgi:hypothetical protein